MRQYPARVEDQALSKFRRQLPYFASRYRWRLEMHYYYLYITSSLDAFLLARRLRAYLLYSSAVHPLRNAALFLVTVAIY